MPMSDENMTQVLESDAGLQDLALRALAAVDQEAVLVVLEDLRGETTFGGRGGGGGAQENDFKHKEYCTSFKKQEAFPGGDVTLHGPIDNNLGQPTHNDTMTLGRRSKHGLDLWKFAQWMKKTPPRRLLIRSRVSADGVKSFQKLIMKIDPPAFEISNLKRREIQAEFFANLIRGVINALGQDRAMELASTAIREDAMQTGRNMADKYNGNTLSELFKVVKEVWAEGDSLEFDIVEKNRQRLSFNVTRCLYSELYDRLGMKEFGFCLSCNRDEAFIQGFNPRMKLLRNQTIMQGAKTCDFRIILE